MTVSFSLTSGVASTKLTVMLVCGVKMFFARLL